MKDKIMIKTSSGNYPVVWFGEMAPLAKRVESMMQNYHRSVFFLSYSIEKIYGKVLDHFFPGVKRMILPDGEKTKSLRVIEEIAVKLSKDGVHRNTLFIAFGGGVTGDFTGFMASIYMRSVDFIQIPTTLLAMVDSSVGGKTGVNLKTGKNLIGSFYPPRAVFILPGFLKTLPDREINGGLAEMVKTAVISPSRDFFSYLEKNVSGILRRDPAILAELSYKSIMVKASIVQKDEKEQNIRAFLNLGHTLAHAIESLLDYKGVIHGEAVSVGLHFAAYYSKEKDYLDDHTYIRIRDLLIRLKLPYKMEDIHKENKLKSKDLAVNMQKDKKVTKSRIRFVFISGIGRLLLPQEVNENELVQTLKKFKKAYQTVLVQE